MSTARVGLGLLVILAVLVAPRPATASSSTALVGATLVDGTGAPPVRDAVVVVRAGTIECAGSRTSCPIPKDATRLDLKGLWITPGIIDAHVHFCQTGWADGRPDALDVRDRHPYEEVQAELRLHPDRFFRSYLCSGVTGVFDVGGFPWTFGLPSRSQSDPAAPHVVASGPLLSTRDFWLNLPGERQFIYLKDEQAARDGVRYVATQGAAAVKIWFIPVQDRPWEEMVASVNAAGDEARRLKLPLIVHATNLREAKDALRAGAGLLVHGVGDAPIDDEFVKLLKNNDAIYCPTLTVRAGYTRMFTAMVEGQAPAIDDPNGCVDPATRALVAETASIPLEKVSAAWVKDPRTFAERKALFAAQERIAAENLKRVADAGIPLAMGTDAGNPLTLHGPAVYPEMEAMQAAGLSPMQVLVASTSGSARALGRSADLGTLSKGKIADLLVVAGDPMSDIANLRKLRFVVHAGVVRSLADLQAVVRH